MAEKPNTQFGARKPVAIRPAQPVKRGQVALLLMGTLAVGSGAYALIPSENCEPNRPGMVAPSGPQTNAECRPRGSSSGSGHGSSGGSSSRSSFFSGDSSSSQASSGTSSDSGSGQVTRGGFGSFAHAFTSHFSGGG
ncbi:MAG TPA: hypothetical protein VK522_10600 [Pseudolabrys sp.]|nr:hypothetical protein [Pseudolabrys sp.]